MLFLHIILIYILTLVKSDILVKNDKTSTFRWSAYTIANKEINFTTNESSILDISSMNNIKRNNKHQVSDARIQKSILNTSSTNDQLDNKVSSLITFKRNKKESGHGMINNDNHNNNATVGPGIKLNKQLEDEFYFSIQSQYAMKLHQNMSLLLPNIEKNHQFTTTSLRRKSMQYNLKHKNHHENVLPYIVVNDTMKTHCKSFDNMSQLTIDIDRNL